MKATAPQVWECEHAIEVSASPETIWTVMADVAGWPRWNAGIARIELQGPFAAGSTLAMTPPGRPTLTTELVEVRECLGFLDKTVVGELTVFVDHRIEPLDRWHCRVVYSLEAFGPGCDEVGPQIACDFPEVLGGLAGQALAAVGGEVVAGCEEGWFEN